MKYFIQTFGCQQNKADSEYIAGMLEALGMEEASTPKSADLFLINTCSVRQTAEDRVYGLALKMAALKKRNPQLKVIVMGCMVGSVRGERKRYPERILRKKLSWADALLDPNQIYSLPNLLVSWQLVSPQDAHLSYPIDPKRKTKKIAFINISTGCDNFCSYCVVPFARGPEVSRPKGDILDEIKKAVRRGYTEITLLGQNVNSWGLEPEIKSKIRAGSSHQFPLAQLLREVHGLEGVEKISFLSSNPFDFTTDLIEVLTWPKIDRYLHLPVQSGDDGILAKMNRRHTVEEYERLVGMIRDRVPEMTLGTDIIVGFPGEGEHQFQNTVKLCRRIGFKVAYIAMYSPRPGTPAARVFPDDVPRKEKKRRWQILNELINKK